MNDYSQLGQTTFASICCPRPGTFLDIGCNSPDFVSNVRGLLEQGWTGVGVDIEDYHKEWEPFSPSMKFIQDDASGLVPPWSYKELSYLSVDVDEDSLKALEAFWYNAHEVPTCATIEHDTYKLGPDMRRVQRRMMGSHGMVLVGNNLWNYEDWYVVEDHPRVTDIAIMLSAWGGEDNSDTQKIEDFKKHLKEMMVTINVTRE